MGKETQKKNSRRPQGGNKKNKTGAHKKGMQNKVKKHTKRPADAHTHTHTHTHPKPPRISKQITKGTQEIRSSKTSEKQAHTHTHTHTHTANKTKTKRKFDAKDEKHTHTKKAKIEKEKPSKQCYRLYSRVIEADKADKATLWAAVKELHTYLTYPTLSPNAPVQPKMKVQFHLPFVSRATQALLKWAPNSEMRRQILDTLEPVFVDMCESVYGHRVAQKIILYSDSERHKRIAHMLSTHTELFYKKYSSNVWEYIFTKAKQSSLDKLHCEMIYPKIMKLTSPHVCTQKLKKVYHTIDTDTRAALLEHMDTLLHRCIEKELLSRIPVHWILNDFTFTVYEEIKALKVSDTQGLAKLENKMSCLLEELIDGITHLLSTKESIEALCRLIGYANAKQRKRIVKELKGSVVKLCTNSVGYLLVIRLLFTVDDTKLLTTSIIKEMLDGEKINDEIWKNEFGAKVIAEIISPNRFMSTYERYVLDLPSPTSLKPFEIRNKELRAQAMPPLQRALCAAFENTDTLTHEIRFSLTQIPQRNLLVSLFDKCADKDMIQICERILTGIQQDAQNTQSGDQERLISHPDGHRSIISLLRVFAARNICVCMCVCGVMDVTFESHLWASVLYPHLSAYLTQRAVFVIHELTKCNYQDLVSQILKSVKECVAKEPQLKTSGRGMELLLGNETQ